MTEDSQSLQLAWPSVIPVSPDEAAIFRPRPATSGKSCQGGRDAGGQEGWMNVQGIYPRSNIFPSEEERLWMRPGGKERSAMGADSRA